MPNSIFNFSKFYLPNHSKNIFYYWLILYENLTPNNSSVRK